MARKNMAAVAGQNSEQLSNNFEVSKFFRVNLQLVKLQLALLGSYLHFFKKMYFRSSRHLHSKKASYLHLIMTVKLVV